MTAQIAIMNANAVALATDSAVTTQNANGVKVHNSANKLFALSKYTPIGIMIHGNASFLGIPWETLIKVYRRQLGKKSFPTVTEYVHDFFASLSSQEIFSLGRQEKWFKGAISQYLQAVNTDYQKKVGEEINEHREVDPTKLNSIFEENLQKAESLVNRPEVEFSGGHHDAEAFKTTATPMILSVIGEIFQALPIEQFKDRLVALVLKRFLVDSSVDYTGVVFAGFGEKEILPVVEAFWTDGILGGGLRYAKQPGNSGVIDDNFTSCIIPLAQYDTVLRFLKGIDPSYKRELDSKIGTLLEAVSTKALSLPGHSQMSVAERQGAEISLKEFTNQKTVELEAALQALTQEQFLSPVMDVIGGLPKDDLATIAEALVNLTSFQRKIRRETESVGGPIDVAVLSKGDGFVWIKRKHYFEKDLNPAFFANYYRGDGDGKEASSTTANS